MSDVSVLLHISDPHFGTEQAPVVEALLALAAAERPELCVLSGDITQRARPAQFAAARAFVDRLGVPMLIVPGNHDIPLVDVWTRLVAPYRRFRRAFGTPLEPRHDSPKLLVLGVRTTRRWRHTNGQVSAAQIARVAAQLRGAAAGQLRIVVVHQPLAVLEEHDAHDLLRGHAEARAAWAAAGADLVLGGHIHLPYVIGFDTPPARPLWVVQAGTALSTRVRGGVPNSVNIVRWDAGAGRCTIERWDHAAGQGAFRRVAVQSVTPAR